MTVEVNAIETVVELPRLAQSEEPGGTGGEARGRGRSYELNGMGGVRHEDYYPRLCDRSRRRRDDRFWVLGALHSGRGKGRSEALHTDDPNNSCRSCPDWPCPGLAPVARVGGLPMNDLRLAMPLYLECLRSLANGQCSPRGGIRPSAPHRGARAVRGAGCGRSDPR